FVVGDDVYRIAVVEHVARMGNDGLVVAADCHGPERRTAQGVHLPDRLARELGRGVDGEYYQCEPAARKVHVFGGGGVAEQVDDFAGGHFFRVEEVVDAQVHEHLLVIGLKIFVVVDAGDGLAGAELLGEDGGDDIDVLLVVYGDEQVCLGRSAE